MIRGATRDYQHLVLYSIAVARLASKAVPTVDDINLAMRHIHTMLP